MLRRAASMSTPVVVPGLRRAVLALALAVALPSSHPAHAEAEESAARLFAAQALALRASGVAGEAAAVEVLAAMPGSGMVENETLARLWGPVFANAIVKLGRMESSGPVALYMDPLLDVAVITYWVAGEDGLGVVAAHALPGSRLADAEAETAVIPGWLTAEHDPFDVLAADLERRIDAFARLHPVDGNEPGRPFASFAGAAADMRSLLPRLAWNAAQRARWVDGSHPWLESALARIEWVLTTRDATVLLAAAPGTGQEAARILADLPEEYTARLILDMVLETEGSERILIGSLPDEGDVFVVALCEAAGSACELQRLTLASLLD